MYSSSQSFSSSSSSSQFSSQSSSSSESSVGSCSSCNGCIVFGIDPWGVPICVGANQQFTADGDVLEELSWTTNPAGTPATGAGPTFTTKWTTVGLGRKVTATCPESGSFFEATVDVVGVDKIVVEGTTNEGPVTINDGTSILLRALRTPAPTSGPWPANSPQWTISKTPGPFTDGHLESVASDPGLIRFFPALDPNDATPATYKVKATCGSSSDEITINVNRCVVTDVSADKIYEKVANTGNAFNVVGVKASAADHVTLTITVAAGTDKTKITWHGDVTVVAGSNNLQAKVPIDASVRKDTLIKYDGVACHEIRVWPVWATISYKIASSDTISEDNQATFLVNGNWPTQPLNYGGGNHLGPIDKWNSTITVSDATGKIEAKATLSPEGIGNIVPEKTGGIANWSFIRRRWTIAWNNGGHYDENNNWQAGPAEQADNVDDTSNASMLDLNPEGADAIYDLDAPTTKNNAPTIIPTVETYSNFTQYMKVFGKTCSDSSPWSSRLRIDYAKASNKVELNETKSYTVALPITPHYAKR